MSASAGIDLMSESFFTNPARDGLGLSGGA